MKRRFHRFFTSSPIEKSGDSVYLDASDTDHLKRTLRLVPGDGCLVTDGKSREAEAVVQELPARGPAKLLIQKIHADAPQGRGIELFLYPAFIQKGKMDDLVRQMQELGVRGFFPIETERTVVKMGQEAGARIVSRWQKIVREAAKQSGSLAALQLREPEPLGQALARIPKGECIVMFHPDKETKSFEDWIKQISSGAKLHLFFGPEGGFTDKEGKMLLDHKAEKVRLGATVLKADTAVLGTASALTFLFP